MRSQPICPAALIPSPIRSGFRIRFRRFFHSPLSDLSLPCQKTAMPVASDRTRISKVKSKDPCRGNFHLSPCIFDHEAAPLDVINSCLIYRLSQPNFALLFLCVVGFCLGVAIFLRGLRLRRIRVEPPASLASISWEANVHMFPPPAGRVAPHRFHEIIRLSPDPVPMNSAEMTQQQKIAAALARAASSNSTAWAHESSGVAVEAPEPDPLEQKNAPVRNSAQLTLTPKSVGTNLPMWCGLALAVLSCYLLVTFH